MYLSFNELSLENVLCDITSEEQARDLITDLVKFIKNLKTDNLCDGLIVCNDFLAISLYEKYCLAEWLHDELVEKTYRQFMQSYICKYCFYIDSTDFQSEFIICIEERDHKGIGCMVAVEHETPIISLISSALWKKFYVDGNYITITENAELESKKVTLENWTSITDIEKLKVQFVNNIFVKVTSGQDLWEKRSAIFPNLVFCESVKDQLYSDPEHFHIVKIMERLKNLQDYFSGENDRYDPKVLGYGARTESESVKTNSDLKKYRLFRMPNGEEKYFFDHIGFSGKFSGGRIYFLPSISERKCYIGYIGRHLPTKKF